MNETPRRWSQHDTPSLWLVFRVTSHPEAGQLAAASDGQIRDEVCFVCSQSISEKDFIEAINRVIKSYKKFSATAKYMVYN